ncbi:MAG: hypothetical protein KGP01_04865 [Actinomycetales bacterium]|nr:hypothetical protein [Actinomycetales bacterium]
MTPRPQLRRAVLCAAAALTALLAALLASPGPATAGRAAAPGYPGADADWRPANKSFFTTAYGLKSSTVWATGQQGTLSEVFYPDLSTPALRELDFAVLDNKGKAWRVSTDATHSTTLDQPDAPVFTNTSTLAGRWRLTTRYLTDPGRAGVLTEVTLKSLDKRRYTLLAMADPSLNNDGADDLAVANKTTASAYEFDAAVTMAASPAFTKTSVGFLGASDAWTDVRKDGKVTWAYKNTDGLAGNTVISGVLPIDGVKQTKASIALGFADELGASRAVAAASLKAGPANVNAALVTGWRTYLGSLRPPPAAALKDARSRQTYLTSVMMLAASEDKTTPGSFIASPSSPWAWGNPGGSTTGYHSVWGRDSYQIGTALLAAGDTGAATRMVRFLLDVQSKSDGGMPQYSLVDGTPMASGVQLDQVALPIVLAWQVSLPGSTIWPQVKAAADYITRWRDPGTGLTAPASGQERWEEKAGYSPSTIAAVIAGLVCASDIAAGRGDSARAGSYLDTAKEWAAKVKSWTVTTTGPLSAQPYFLRLSRTGDPNAGTSMNTGNGGPTVDERSVVDAGFLELVRLGVLPADDPDVVASLKVIDSTIAAKIGAHTYYYRYNHDGYGEAADGSAWSMSSGGVGRLWPLLSGERGEYNLAAGRSAAPQLAAMAAAASPVGLLSEQVWDAKAPAKVAVKGKKAPAFTAGTGTMSATPLAWTQAQFVRLAWSIEAGRPVETPSIVHCRLAGTCAPR